MNFVEQHNLLVDQIKHCENRNHRRKLWWKANAYLAQEGKCVFCKEPMFASELHSPNRKKTATMEHVTPRCQGGGWNRENIVASCQRCNNTRMDMDFDAFMYIAESVDYDEIKRTTMALHACNAKTFCDVVSFLLSGKVNIEKYAKRGY